MESVAVDSRFFEIQLAHLEPATVLDFDLFLWHPGRRPQHFRDRDLEFTPEIRERLVANGVRQLLVPTGQMAEFERYRVRHDKAPLAPPPDERAAAPLPPEEARLPEVLGDRAGRWIGAASRCSASRGAWSRRRSRISPLPGCPSGCATSPRRPAAS